MRQVTSRPYEDKSIPHLSLYVHHMNKSKLLREREVLLRRLDEVDKQIRYEEEHIVSLRPKLGLSEEKRPRQHSRGGNGEKEKGRKTIAKMKLAF
jgi:hypothetical protein